jgi:hypothetical protein
MAAGRAKKAARRDWGLSYAADDVAPPFQSQVRPGAKGPIEVPRMRSDNNKTRLNALSLNLIFEVSDDDP